MSRLEEIKNEWAKLLGYDGYFDFTCHKKEVKDIEQFFNEIIERYAKECVKASLEKASESGYCTYDAMIDRESITNPENIILL